MSRIEVRIGATWIKPEYVDQFMRETFKTPEYLTRSYGLGGATVGVQYSAVTGVWNVKGKNADRANPIANSTYGTMRANAYKILEDSLNLKDSRVYDTVLEEGKEKRVLNKKETTRQKQEAIREAFKDWIFAAPERRADLVETYNKLFNSIRPREYEGAHLTFPGMSPEVTLRPHQKNAVAHQLYGDKGAQLIFCDLSTPKNDGNFNVYDDIKQKLMSKGVPENEIAFIHDANTETKKADLFAKVRSGDVRFLLGSTAKMGAGTNVQDRLIALHHLDVPWRPSDIEQQEGRIIRQGNMYKELGKPVKIFRYVTEGTFDSYSWQVIENKQKFIGQIMTSKSPVRSCEDVDEAALTYAEVKALCTGNPYIKEKMDLDIQVSKLKLLKANHTSQRYRLEDNITQTYPKQIAALSEKIAGYKADIETFKTEKAELAARSVAVFSEDGKEKEPFEIRIGKRVFTDRKEAGTALIEMCRNVHSISTPVKVGDYMGFSLAVTFEPFQKTFDLSIN